MLTGAVAAEVEAKGGAIALRIAGGTSIKIPLSTVSRVGTFDALISLRFGIPGNSVDVRLIVDSGNDTLILPSFDAIKALPNFATEYTILSECIQEPYRCPAKLLRGPIVIPTSAGDFRIENCSFFVCTGPNSDQLTTYNFGTGWISQWENFTDKFGKTFTVLPPLRTGAKPYRYVEFDYAPAAAVMTGEGELKVAGGSILTLMNDPPPGYQMFDITRGSDAWWMSVKVRSLTIGQKRTGWPGTGTSYPMAMVDTGGGPVLLSDPDGLLYPTVWPEQVELPDWASASTPSLCQAIKYPLEIEIGDGNSWFSYRIDTTSLPAPVQDLTLVLCKDCSFMQGNRGMNIGGISVLFNYILIDNVLGKVGFKSKNLAVA
jgi:hypothetical protein